MRIYSQDTINCVDSVVTVQGWVNSRRDHGGLIFVDLRDHLGIIQLTIDSSKEGFNIAEELRDEYVIEATGQIVERADELKNDHLATGGIEMKVANLRILNKSAPLPVSVNDSQLSNEETRLRYRFIDLRRPKMQNMLQKRSDFYKSIRAYMDANEFTEVTTPILANSSPEGARDFLVPSRLQSGKFYALPQAPQQFKQLLMVGGVHRYYQIATCFRDEDPRADRLYGDFYQLDLEMSFVEKGETVRQATEPLIIDLVENFAGKTLKDGKVSVLTYQEAMENYGSDKPDLRFDLKLFDVSSALADCKFGVFKNNLDSGGSVKALVAPKTFSRSQIDALTEYVKLQGAGGLPYIVVEQDGSLNSSITKFMSEEELHSIKNITSAQPGDTIFFGTDKIDKVNSVLGALRSHLGDLLGLKDPSQVALAWIINFPFYELDDKGKLDFGHNPFSMPIGGLDDLQKSKDKLSIMADQFDMVMNGYEVCSGAVRNHNPDVMYEVFNVLGYDKHYVEKKFGAMLNAFKYGAPPHAGCAFGLDRIFMVLMDEDNIREIVAFPKNGSGIDLMMDSPSEVDKDMLSELSIDIAEG